MDCPQCKGYQLEPVEIEPGLLGGICAKCNGTLIALMNYRYWADQNKDIDTLVTDEVVTEENGKAKLCPKCSRLMTRYQIGAQSDNRIDLCAGCDEVWLDKGEWRLLKQLDMHDKLPKIITDAWQRNIRIKRQEQKLKQQYEEKLGREDFRQLDTFKQWLDKHPNKAEMKQYLVTTLD